MVDTSLDHDVERAIDRLKAVYQSEVDRKLVSKAVPFHEWASGRMLFSHSMTQTVIGKAGGVHRAVERIAKVMARLEYPASFTAGYGRSRDVTEHVMFLVFLR